MQCDRSLTEEVGEIAKGLGLLVSMQSSQPELTKEEVVAELKRVVRRTDAHECKRKGGSRWWPMPLVDKRIIRRVLELLT